MNRRTATAMQPVSFQLPQGCTSVRWFAPDEDVPIVLWGAHGKALERLVRELAHVQRFVAAGVDPPSRMLFAGPSGTGKTLAARWLARKLGKVLGIFDVASTVGSHLGETAASLKEGFDHAERVGAIVFLDEIDALCARRTGDAQAASRELERATTSIFQRLDWLPAEHMVIAATNFADAVDAALARRMPTRVDFSLPDAAARRALVDLLPASKHLGEEALSELVGQTTGSSAADVRAKLMALAREALMAQADTEAVPDMVASEPPPLVEKRKRRAMVEGTQSLLERLDGVSRGDVPS